MANGPISGFTTGTPTDSDVAPYVLAAGGAGSNRKFLFSGLTTYLKTALNNYFNAGVPNYISNQWYYAHGVGVGMVTGVVATAAGDVVFEPFLVVSTITIKSMCGRVATLSASGQFAFAIYANDNTLNRPTGNPLTQLLGLSAAAAAAVSGPISTTTLTMTPGIYWLATQVSDTTLILATPSNASPAAGAIVGAGSATNLLPSTSTVGNQAFLMSGTFGASGTFPTVTSGTSLSTTNGNRGGAAGFQIN